jgi:D-sedoheptulose 7-phosphate isomerase
MILHSSLTELIERYPALDVCSDSLCAALDALKSTFVSGGKVLLCGNGGSNADCDHIAAELMKTFLLPRPLPREMQQNLIAQDATIGKELATTLQRALPAISLGSHNALATAVANDCVAEITFAQQVYALAKPEDLLWGISTSGNARNVQRAVLTAKAMNIKTLGLTGAHGGKLGELCDITIHAPADRVDRIQELHLPIYHALCSALEDMFFGKELPSP